MTPNQITAQNAGWPPQFRFAGSVVSSGVCEFHRSARMILCKVLTAALLVVAGHGLSAERIRVPQFGKPLAVSDKLIFAGPGLKPDRLICIEKESGEPAWQITNEVQTLLAWCVLSNWVIVSVGPDLYRCNVELGHLDLLYRTGHEHDAFVYDEQDGTLLVTGGNGRMGYLARVDPGSGRALWERDRHGYVVAQGEKVLLCAESKRFAVATGGYGATDERWVGVSKQDGRALWSCPPNAAGVAVGDYFLVFLKDTFNCLKQLDGTVVKSFNLKTEPYPGVSLAVEGQQVLVKVSGVGSTTVKDVHFSLNVPSLVWSSLTQGDWRAATRSPSPHDEVYEYTCRTSSDWERTSVVRTEFKTGKSQVLYEEELPLDLRRGRKQRVRQP